jgi:hypothetical protein
MKEHPLKALIAAHLLGGASGLSLSPTMSQQEVEMRVSVAMRIARAIVRQVAESILDSECLIAAHLLGGTSGLTLTSTMPDHEIETRVGAAVLVVKEMDKQAKQLEMNQ